MYDRNYRWVRLAVVCPVGGICYHCHLPVSSPKAVPIASTVGQGGDGVYLAQY